MTVAHLPRDRYSICDFSEYRRPRRALVSRVMYRNAINGLPVCVLVPTLRGRIVMGWRQWTEAR